MSIAKSYSAQLIGMHAEIVTVEVDISNGLNHFSIVGLGDRSVFEAKDRISAAIKNSGYVSPKQKNQKVVISLAPADIRKEGSVFDLAMAIAYLCAAKDIQFNPEGKLFLGELSLEGNVKRIAGVLPVLCQLKNHGFNTAFIPIDNIREASLARGIKVHVVSNINQIIAHLSEKCLLKEIEPYEENKEVEPAKHWIDMSVIRGNETAKRGLEIAAAGGHNIIMCGPPGTGKTMLAQSFSSILPTLSHEQSIEVTGIHSAAHVLNEGLIVHPPFRSPHHTASYPAIVGGGVIPRPGEITLAHRGVLFMDEFPEFDRSVLEALRQPLEERLITISRARGSVTFPAQCILVASMNPCPCGKSGSGDCRCFPKTIEAYRRRVSGPIMDRLDIWVNVNKVDYEKLALRAAAAEESASIRGRVAAARKRQEERFKKFGINKTCNTEMGAQDIEKIVEMEPEARETLKISAEKFHLSGRAFHRVIKVAQTIADLTAIKNQDDKNREIITKEYILEALQYREKSN